MVVVASNQQASEQHSRGRISVPRSVNMSSSHRPASATGPRDKTYFEQQREALVGEIAMVSNSLPSSDVL